MDLKHLKLIESQLLWTACWMIHNANHLRPKEDNEVKVGGHQASSSSIVSIMTALYFHALKPEDRIAVKPHASPVFHAIQYLMGNQTRSKLENFRAFGGAQSYPSRTKDIDDVDFSTGSVGLGAAVTIFASTIQDYLIERNLGLTKPGRMVALVGDAELDEGNVYEALLEGWKLDVRNVWWVIDYNRQSLDSVVHEGLWERIEEIFRAFGWQVIRLKYGHSQQQAFKEPGGEHLKNWIDNCPNSLYSALTFQGGMAWRKRLMDEIGDQGSVSALLERRSDSELAQLMENLGGHCLKSLCESFDNVTDDNPTVFLAYTIKGWGTPLAGHKDNHAGLMTQKQMAGFQVSMGVSEGHEWHRFATVLTQYHEQLQTELSSVPFFARGTRVFKASLVKSSKPIFVNDSDISTQTAFGKILDSLAKENSAIAQRVITASPDVTVSTNLGPWVNRRGLFARKTVEDTFREERIPSLQKWKYSPQGQHIELGISEMNLALFLGAAGLSHSLFGERLIPIGTLYDPFIMRNLDALNYACYMDARFIMVGTPSGITLAPEGGAHQSICTPLIGISQDGLASFEPAFADELSVILDWSFDYLQREEKDSQAKTHNWSRDEGGGSVYLRLSTRSLEQPRLKQNDQFYQGVINGAYWMRKPGPNAEIVLAYQGAVAPEVIAAAGRIGHRIRDIGVLAVTSSDRLNAGWTSAKIGRREGRPVVSHIEELLADIPSYCQLITVSDGHPLALAWLGSVHGHEVHPLGVEHFGQSGTINALYRHFGIDTDTIVRTANRVHL
ncbi:MAG: transketolase [Rhodobacteraceae bacterium]|nr:transketolase [Paracoccaceae bacterium]